MGDTTSNMGIYIPDPGEELFHTSFKAGQERVDTHNHEGAPTGGVQLGEAALKDGTVTPNKLSNQVRHEYNYISNLGIAYASPTFSVTSSDGSALSSSNRAYVTFQSKTNPGQLITLNTATNASFEDATGTSDIAGNLFGYTSGVDVLTDIQFYLYAVMNDAQDTLEFALSLEDCLDVSPTTAKMGSPASATADDSDSMWFFNDVTFGDYDGNPVRRIACFRMQKTGGAANDWTVQGLTTSDGVGKCSCNADGQPFTQVEVDGSSSPGTNPVVADLNGKITVTGEQVAAGTVGATAIRTFSDAANSYKIQMQRSTTSSSANADHNGVSHFDSASFQQDTNGWVQLLGGTIRQIVTNLNVAGSTTSSTSLVDVTGASATITPSSTSHKILVCFNYKAGHTNVIGTNVSYYASIFRDATDISGTDVLQLSNYSGGGNDGIYTWLNYITIDSPSTTSAITYKLQHRMDNGSATASSENVNIILLELVG